MLCAASDAQCSTYLLLVQFSIRTEIFFLSIYGPSTKRAGRQKEKNEKKKTKQNKSSNKRNAVRGSDVCSMASRLGDRKGPETTAGHVAGHTIWQSFDRRQKKKVLLVHENINT